MENITVKKHLVIALIFAILFLIFSFKFKPPLPRESFRVVILTK
jgi:hypothetical protein